ncbi:small ribosomal subunit protein bS21m-like [Lineus longissimus]|uniref:small ribosomal subunit protein bS21m-like n=1 Tax=Lineus longissimus TaxID=88925 RepID=UPI002B4F76F2
MSRNHIRFLAKTVLVKNGEVEVAYRALDRILHNEKIIDENRRNQYYEKPAQWRKRIMYERAKRIYNSEMQRKIQFISRKNRIDPFPR